MSDDQTPDIEEIKERIEIPVDEDIDQLKEEAKAETRTTDVVEEMKNLGKQFVSAMETAWNSEERHRFEEDIRKGVNSFVGEVDKAIREAKDSPTAERVRTEAAKAKTDVETSDIGRKTREGVVQGLHWMSVELGKLADQFTPSEEETAAEEPTAEKSPEDIDDGS